MDDQPLFIESICIKDQSIQLLDYHNKRANEARLSLYGISDEIDFDKIIEVNGLKDSIVKCRIVYGDKIKTVEYQPYRIRPINSLKSIEIDDHYNYKHKYLDRSTLDHYFSLREEADDIIMIQNGYVTDSYYGNLAFLKDGTWYTPEKPLLKGTRRAYLIDDKQLEEIQIPDEDIPTYESVRVFNAMIEFGQIEIDMRFVD